MIDFTEEDFKRCVDIHEKISNRIADIFPRLFELQQGYALNGYFEHAKIGLGQDRKMIQAFYYNYDDYETDYIYVDYEYLFDENWEGKETKNE